MRSIFVIGLLVSLLVLTCCSSAEERGSEPVDVAIRVELLNGLRIPRPPDGHILVIWADGLVARSSAFPHYSQDFTFSQMSTAELAQATDHIMKFVDHLPDPRVAVPDALDCTVSVDALQDGRRRSMELRLISWFMESDGLKMVGKQSFEAWNVFTKELDALKPIDLSKLEAAQLRLHAAVSNGRRLREWLDTGSQWRRLAGPFLRRSNVSSQVSTEVAEAWFADAVSRLIVPMLMARKFEVTRPERSLFRLESQRVVITLRFDSYTSDLDVCLSSKSNPCEQFGLCEMLELALGSNHGKICDLQARAETMEWCVETVAGYLSKLVDGWLDVDPDCFQKLGEISRQRRQADTQELIQRPVRMAAEAAWLARDFSRVRELYGSIHDGLSASERRRWEYAKRH